MKSLAKFTLVLLTIIAVAVTLQSCEAVENLADVDFNTSINERISIHVNQGQENINESIVLSIVNEDTNDYLDLLESVSITKFTYKIIDFTGDENGSMDVVFLVDGVTLLQENFIVKQAYDNQTIFEITDTSKLNTMASALKNNHQISASIIGTSFAEDSMDFKSRNYYQLIYSSESSLIFFNLIFRFLLINSYL